MLPLLGNLIFTTCPLAATPDTSLTCGFAEGGPITSFFNVIWKTVLVLIFFPGAAVQSFTAYQKEQLC